MYNIIKLLFDRYNSSINVCLQQEVYNTEDIAFLIKLEIAEEIDAELLKQLVIYKIAFYGNSEKSDEVLDIVKEHIMEFTSRGLIKKGKSYVKSWDDLFLVEGRDNKYKKSRFKAKYNDLIKQVTFKSNGRTYTYMVASQELAKNKLESDLQKLAKGEEVEEVKTNRQLTKELHVNKNISQVFGILSDMINYHWNGKYQLVDGQIIETEDTGEVIFNNKHLMSTISYLLKEGAAPESIAWTILINLKNKIDPTKVKVIIDECGDTYYSFFQIAIKEE